jgi:uncharacterized phage infection (PIP) family protein YhgE
MSPYIEHKTPSQYWYRHSDWYQGTWKYVCDAWGKIEEYQFYLQCEEHAHEADVLGWIPLLGDAIKNLWINIWKQVYNAKYVDMYDNASLKACKFFEQLEDQVNKVLGEIKTQVESAKTYIQTNFISPIQSKISVLNDSLTKAQSRLSDLNVSLNAFGTRLSDAEASVKSALDSANTALNRATSVLNDVNNLKTKADQMMADLKNKSTQITQIFNDLKTKASQINELFSRVKALEEQFGKPYQPQKSIWETLLGK